MRSAVGLCREVRVEATVCANNRSKDMFVALPFAAMDRSIAKMHGFSRSAGDLIAEKPPWPSEEDINKPGCHLSGDARNVRMESCESVPIFVRPMLPHDVEQPRASQVSLNLAQEAIGAEVDELQQGLAILLLLEVLEPLS